MAEGGLKTSFMRNNFDTEDQKQNLSKEKKVEEVKKEEKIVNQAPETAFPDLPDDSVLRASRQSSSGSATAFLTRHEECSNTDLKKALVAPPLTPFWSQESLAAETEDQPNQPEPDTSETSQTSNPTNEVREPENSSDIVSSYVRFHRSLSSTQAALSTTPQSEQTFHSQGSAGTNVRPSSGQAASEPASPAERSGLNGSNPSVSSTSPPEQTLPIYSATGGTNNLDAGHAPTPPQPPFIPYPAGVYPSVMVPYFPVPVGVYPHHQPAFMPVPPFSSCLGTSTMGPYSGSGIMGYPMAYPVGQSMMPNIQQPNMPGFGGSAFTAMFSSGASRAPFDSRNVPQNIQRGQTSSVPSSEENNCSDSPPSSYNSNTRLTQLPKPALDWLRKRLDQMSKNNWEILANARGWNYLDISDHDDECRRFGKSPFLELLKTEKFITYTINDLMADIKDTRKDIVIDFQSVLENNK